MLLIIGDHSKVISIREMSSLDVNRANENILNDVYNRKAGNIELIQDDTRRILKATEDIIMLRLLQLQMLREARL